MSAEFQKYMDKHYPRMTVTNRELAFRFWMGGYKEGQEKARELAKSIVELEAKVGALRTELEERRLPPGVHRRRAPAHGGPERHRFVDPGRI